MHLILYEIRFNDIFEQFHCLVGQVVGAVSFISGEGSTEQYFKKEGEHYC